MPPAASKNNNFKKSLNDKELSTFQEVQIQGSSRADEFDGSAAASGTLKEVFVEVLAKPLGRA